MPAVRTTSAASNLAIPLLAILAMNALVFGLHWDAAARNPVALLDPPDWLVPAVWVALFALMGAARLAVLRVEAPSAQRLARRIVLYMLFCLAYPFYTLGLSSDALGFIGNIATFAFALWLIAGLWSVSRFAALCLSPVLPWLVYASLTMIR